jgi:hypothetical protein
VRRIKNPPNKILICPNSDGVTVEVGGDCAVEIRAVDVDPGGLEAGEYDGFGQAERRVIANRDHGKRRLLPPKFRAWWKCRCRCPTFQRSACWPSCATGNPPLAGRKGGCPYTGKISLSGESEIGGLSAGRFPDGRFGGISRRGGPDRRDSLRLEGARDREPESPGRRTHR